MTTEPVTTRTAKIWLREDGINQVVILPNAQEGLADAQANVAAGFRIGPQRRHPLLVDIRAMKSIDRDARTYYSSGATAQMISALALLVESPLSRVLANFFMGLNKMPVPTRLFTSEDEAVAWLKGFRE